MNTAISFLLLAFFFFIMMRYGCGSMVHGGHGGHNKSEANPPVAPSKDQVDGKIVQ